MLFLKNIYYWFLIKKYHFMSYYKKKYFIYLLEKTTGRGEKKHSERFNFWLDFYICGYIYSFWSQKEKEYRKYSDENTSYLEYEFFDKIQNVGKFNFLIILPLIRLTLFTLDIVFFIPSILLFLFLFSI